MSASYQSILWNRQKKIYDRVLFGFIGLYLLLFIVGNLVLHPQITQETLIIRAFGTLGFFMLNIILMIGPLARLNTVFLPLLYNRRHFGVTMFCMGAVHGIFSIIQFHALGNINPVLSVFQSNVHYESLTRFPFQTLGFFALTIFFLMAISSHDFWLHNLGPRFWKIMHMLVYLAYTLIILHVLLGIVQFETSPVFVSLIAIGFVTISTLHLVAGYREVKKDNEEKISEHGFHLVCDVHDIDEKKAKVVCLNNERIAVYKYDNKVSAISNVCKHQNGPLGEGRIIDGCITCPWHGYQYLPQNGSSPPPFKEKVCTYDVRIINNQIWVNPLPHPEGTEVQPASINPNS